MNKDQKKKAVIVLAFVCALAVVLCAVMVMDMNREKDDTMETVKPSVTIPPSPPESTETAPPNEPLLHEGKIFRILCGAEPSFDFGDSVQDGSLISRMTYGRNLNVCRRLGVTFSFDYMQSVYQGYTDLLKSGKADYDLLNVNMLSDGSGFLMNGGLDNVYSSSLELSSPAFDTRFMDTFKYEGKGGFLLGEANPSRILGANVLFVPKALTNADLLVGKAQSGELTYDALLGYLAETEASMGVDEETFHAMLSTGGIFGFSSSGEPSVEKTGYTHRYSALLPYIRDGLISEAEHEGKTAFVSDLASVDNFERYYVLPMPKYSSSDSYSTTADMSSLLAYAVPSALSDRAKTYDVISLIYSESVGFTEAYARERSLEDYGLWFGNIKYCFYDMFGWGDFSEHAWKACLEFESADSLSSRLTAPTRAAEQALLILSERWRTHFGKNN